MTATDQADAPREDRADRVAKRLAIPVLVAALASVPAVFLTLLDEPWTSIGDGLNTLSGAVLIAETVVLLVVADDKRAWARRNWWLFALIAIIVPAVIFALGPAQLLRLVRPLIQLVRFAGALRIVRIKRIIKAGKILRERAGLDEGWQRAIGIGVTVLCAAFVAVVLVDPSSQSRQWLDRGVSILGWPGIVVAGLIVAVATYVVMTNREDEEEREGPSSEGQGTDAPELEGDADPTEQRHARGEPDAAGDEASEPDAAGDEAGEPDVTVGDRARSTEPR